MAATTEKYVLGTIATVASTELNSLANNALAAGGTPYNNVQGGGGGDGYGLCDVELVVTFSVAPSANSGIYVWFLAAADGTNYEDGSSSITPARFADVVFPLRAVTTAQRITKRVLLPWGLMTVLTQNAGTGQSFASSGNILKIRPVARQGV